MGRSMKQPRLVVYPFELFVILLNCLFCVCSLVNIGKLQMSLFGLTFDRELFYGLVFLLLSPLMLLFIRLTNPLGSVVVQFLRLCYVQLLYILYFTECIWLSQLMFGGASFDGIFARIDYMIFGFQPAVRFPRYFQQYPLVNEMFFFSYFFYYGLISTGVWVLYFRKKHEQAVNTLFIISVSFFILYVWYIFFPVKGPKYFFERLHQAWYSNFHGYVFTGIMKELFNRTNLAGAAFPSSHVALALIAFVLNWKHNRFLVPVYLPLTVLLFLSTVYLYAHYFIDIVAGIAVGIVLLILVPRLMGSARSAAERASAILAEKLGFPEIALPE
jgi:membrane-associated phospholipid phosphatase